MTFKQHWWGRSSVIDLHDCEHNELNNPQILEQFIHKLCRVIKMKRHGPTHIGRFGSGNLRGWSAMQFIETSSIVIHLDDKNNRVFVDIFSCKRFSPQTAALFCKKFFKARALSFHTLERL